MDVSDSILQDIFRNGYKRFYVSGFYANGNPEVDGYMYGFGESFHNASSVENFAKKLLKEYPQTNILVQDLYSSAKNGGDWYPGLVGRGPWEYLYGSKPPDQYFTLEHDSIDVDDKTVVINSTSKTNYTKAGEEFKLPNEMHKQIGEYLEDETYYWGREIQSDINGRQVSYYDFMGSNFDVLLPKNQWEKDIESRRKLYAKTSSSQSSSANSSQQIINEARTYDSQPTYSDGLKVKSISGGTSNSTHTANNNAKQATKQTAQESAEQSAKNSATNSAKQTIEKNAPNIDINVAKNISSWKIPAIIGGGLLIAKMISSSRDNNRKENNNY